MNGMSHPKITSKALPVNRVLIDILILTFTGAVAILLRAYLRIPLNIPGHHGLEVMAILIIGRKITKIPFGSSISTLTAATFIFLPFLGFKDPFLPFIYMAMGFIIDLVYNKLNRVQDNFLLLGFLGGFAYMMIPLIRFILFVVSGYPFETFLKQGFVLPFFTHFFFGALGGMMAHGIVTYTRKITA